MGILGLKNNYLLLFLLLIIGCNKKNNTICNRIVNMNSIGYSFYENINLFERKGYDKLYPNQCDSFPNSFYGILEKEDEIIVYSSSKEGKTGYTTYKKSSNYITATEIFKDDEFSSLYYREVSIIDNTKAIKYIYQISENHEQLLELEIISSDGIKTTYTNTDNLYYDYRVNLAEDSIHYYYPTLNRLTNSE
jgi:hypothetical protein